ncbi:serine/threonine-protein kinase PCRK1-like protein [Tanacetum coccineum]
MQTGRLTYKSDVWSYGVFLYELITVRRPLDLNRPKNKQKLLDWSAQNLAAVANKFLLKQARIMPRMSQVLEMVNQIVETDRMGLEEPLPPLKPITTQADIGCDQRSEQGEAEKEIGLDHGCLLLPRTTNGNTIVVPVVGVNHVVIVKLSYPFKQVQIAIEAVTLIWS